jgi:membrane protein involved in colicin uptake
LKSLNKGVRTTGDANNSNDAAAKARADAEASAKANDARQKAEWAAKRDAEQRAAAEKKVTLILFKNSDFIFVFDG